MSEVRVLIPLDGSKLAESALAYVAPLKHVGEPKVLLLSAVAEIDDSPPEAQKNIVERDTNLLRTYLRDASAYLKANIGVDVDTKVLEGNPAQRILEAADSFGTELVVISTHGRSGLNRWRLGSVADKVIRGAICDTLVIGPKPAEEEAWFVGIPPEFKKILVPLDGSQLAEQALPRARSFAQAFGSELHLVRVATDAVVGQEDNGTDGEPINKASQDYLTQMAGELEPVPSKTAVLIGGVADELLRYAEETLIGLTIVASHGRSGFMRAALGSVTDRLLGGIAPVLIVHPEPT